MLERRVLGRTGLEVSVLGLGGLFLSTVGDNDSASARPVLERAFQRGVNYIDTAPTYANSEEVLGSTLKALPQHPYLSTKIGGKPTPFNPKDGDAIRRSVEESLSLLGLEYIDILFIHEPDRPGLYDWWSDYASFEGPVNDVLGSLKAEGLVHFTGLAGTTAYELARVAATGRYDVVLTAYNYSLLWTEAEIAILPEAERNGLGVIAGSPLQQGALSRRYDLEVASGAPWMSPPRRRQIRELYALVDELGISLPELALRFIISNPAVDVVLTGARSVAEVDANIDAVEQGPLPSAVLERLREIASMVPFRPTEEPLVLPFERPYLGPAQGR